MVYQRDFCEAAVGAFATANCETKVKQRCKQIADQMEHAIGNGATADEAEAMAIEQIQKLGGELLADWAQARQQQALEQAQTEHPQSLKHIKKK